jgi:uncharacterized protein (TIGR03067 family)
VEQNPDDRWGVIPEGSILSFYHADLDPAANPKTITLNRRDGQGEPRLGIYEIKGDTLKVCFGLAAERPKRFGDAGREMVLKKQR